jgi:hypothetical protein
MKFLDEWRLSRVKEPLEYVFSWMEKKDPRRKEIETVMALYESIAAEAKHAGDYVNYGFRRSQDLAGLQCVDAISWVCYRVSLRNFQLKALHPLAVDPEKEFHKENWLHLLTVTRENLQEWISKEMIDPKALEYFRKFTERKKNQR